MHIADFEELDDLDDMTAEHGMMMMMTTINKNAFDLVSSTEGNNEATSAAMMTKPVTAEFLDDDYLDLDDYNDAIQIKNEDKSSSPPSPATNNTDLNNNYVPQATFNIKASSLSTTASISNSSLSADHQPPPPPPPKQTNHVNYIWRRLFLKLTFIYI